MTETSETTGQSGQQSPTCCDTQPAGLSIHDAEKTAAVLKALADPVRLQLFSRITAAENQVCVCDIQDVGVSQPTVSHHLRKLREAGLIDCQRRGTWVYYWTVPGALVPVRRLLFIDGTAPAKVPGPR